MALLSACSGFLDFQVDQCRADQDCSTGAFEDGQWSCQNNLCVRIDCEKNSDCRAGEAADPRVCVDHRCVPLETTDCNRRIPEGEISDDAILLGAFGLPQPEAPEYLNYRLAIDELNSEERIPENRQVVLVICSRPGLDDLAAVLRGFEHLSDTLHVPAIIADLELEDLKELFVVHNASRQLFFLSPFGSDGALFQDRGLLWYLLAPIADYAPPFVPLLERTLDYVSRTREIDKPRLAIVKATYGFGDALWGTLRGTLTIQGRSLTDVLREPGRVRLFDVPSAHDIALVDELNQFAPDVILSLSSHEFEPTLGALERDWAARNGDKPRPFYVLSPLNAFSEYIRGFIELADVGSVQDRMQRFVGINIATAQDSSVYDAYAEEFIRAFGRENLGAENYYDAVYFLAYAALAASPRNMPVTGRGMARAFQQQLLSGVEVPVGRAGKKQAFWELGREGGSIRLMGALGPPDFNLAQGTREGNGSVYCLAEEDGRIGFRYDVLSYDKARGQLESNAKQEFCFPGF